MDLWVRTVLPARVDLAGPAGPGGPGSPVKSSTTVTIAAGAFVDEQLRLSTTVRVYVVVRAGDASVVQLLGFVKPSAGDQAQLTPPNPVSIATSPGVIVAPPLAIAVTAGHDPAPTPLNAMGVIVGC